MTFHFWLYILVHTPNSVHIEISLEETFDLLIYIEVVK